MPIKYIKEDNDQLRVREIDGYCTFPWEVLPNHDEEFRSIPTWQSRDDDLMICAYPKSGTHWSYEILNMLLSQKAERVESYKQSGMLDFISQKQFDDLPSPRVLNSHSLFSELPVDFLRRKCKIVHIVRNPKDVAVSFFHHHKGIKSYEYNGSWNSYLSRFLKGQVDYGSWFDYTLDWEKTIEENPDYPIHLMFYEDMIEDIQKEVIKLAKFLGVSTDSTPDFVQNVVKLCSIDEMRKEKVTSDALSMWNEGSVGLYRKGIIGDWKTMFTVAENEMFDKVYDEKMRNSKLEIRFGRRP